MKVIILAAGYGTRLYPLTENTPKPLLLIKEKPLLNYLLEKVKDFDNLNEIIVVSNDKFYSDFCQWRKTIKNLSCALTIINDETKTPEDRLGSIGDIEFVLKKMSLAEDILVIGGDNLFDYSLNDFMVFCRKKSPQATIGLFDIKDKNQAKLFGVVGLGKDSQITSFEEKPAVPKSSLIAMCLYYFPKNSLHLFKDYLQSVKKSDTAGEYINWLSRQEAVYGYTFNGQWFDVGSFESYRKAQEFF